MTSKSDASRGRSGPPGGWKATLAAVLKARNGARRDGAVASFATRDKRADVLYAGFQRLRDLDFRLDTVKSLRSKHVEVLVKDWHERGLSASTLQNNLSIFRAFAGGITSHGLRHQYAQERYRELTGTDSPVRGGALVDRDTDHAARCIVAEELGHSREEITTQYLGR